MVSWSMKPGAEYLLRKIAPLPGVLVFGSLSACLIENPEFEGATGSGASSSTTGACTGACGTGPTTGGDAPTGGSGSGGGTTGDATSGAADSSTTGGDTTPDGTTIDATTAMPPPPPMRVDHYTPGNCTQPLWCFNNGINDGISGAMAGAECFETPGGGPYRVHAIVHVIAQVKNTPQIKMRVWDSTGNGPGNEIYASSGFPAVPGEHVHDIPEPERPLLTTSHFCVGFLGGNDSSSVGVAADESSQPPDAQSYYGSSACPPLALVDVNDYFPNITPYGAWCLGADVGP